jgi:LacI family transcriptional regulator
MVTQQDVAKKAGVSFITVSRVINNNGYVKEETRQRVLDTIKKLNYYPNHIGRALHTKSVNTIGVIIPAPAHVTVHGTDYYNLLMAGIEQSTATNGFDLLLSTYRFEDPQTDYLRLYYQRKVDGLILITPNLKNPQIGDIAQQHIPCVIIGDRPENMAISYVDTDNFRGMQHLTEHLIGNGHRRIAFVKGPGNARNAGDRFDGFLQAMQQNDLPIENDWIFEGDFTPESGRQAMQKILALRDASPKPPLPSALVCANDLTALGALSEAKNADIKIPEQMALVGFDGIGATALTDPPLTTVSQPLFDIGFTASEMLLNTLKDPLWPQENKIFPVELIRRKSS